jgi:hypothetical protein
VSDAQAEIFTPTGERIGFTTYQGSADCLSPHIAATAEDAWVYRDGKSDESNAWDRLQACSHEPVEAIAYSSYGGGDHWPVKVCRPCRVIVERLSPYPLDYGYSLPSPEEQRADEEFRAAGWPKRGHPFPEVASRG